MNHEAIQTALRQQGIDGWLFYDHHHRDPIATRILGLDPKAHVTRRWYYLIPANGEPQKLVHRIEQFRLDALPGAKQEYSGWRELAQKLEQMLAGSSKLAMQYSPENAILYVSMVDAGTVEFLRGLGKQIVTSADLVSQFEAVLTADQKASHQTAQRAIDAVLAEAWREIARQLRPASGNPETLTEFTLMEWLANAMRREGITWENGPNVSVGPNSADSHYEPTANRSRPIRNGDFLLIDIWGKVAAPLPSAAPAIHYDITWTGVIGRPPTDREQHIFTLVRDARDAAITSVERAFAASRPIQGFEADDAARAVIASAGFGEFFTHRTGHNIAAEIHGTGAHLDNLETHDQRLILADTCFSVEPGIYLPGDFGLRSEVNMLTETGRAWVTGPRQQELVRI